MPDVYRTGEKRAILDFLLRPADVHHTKGFIKPMLKRKFHLLFDIVQKVIAGITYSLDAITLPKVRIMAAIIDNAKVNWQGFLKKRLLEESTKFVEENSKVVLTSKITMLHKVSLILIDLMLGRDWSEDEMVSYVLTHKMMLIVKKSIPGLADDGVEPAIKSAKELL